MVALSAVVELADPVPLVTEVDEESVGAAEAVVPPVTVPLSVPDELELASVEAVATKEPPEVEAEAEEEAGAVIAESVLMTEVEVEFELEAGADEGLETDVEAGVDTGVEVPLAVGTG